MHWIFYHLHSEKLYSGHAKCVFVQIKTKYTGHIVGGGVFAMDLAKMHAIIDWPDYIYVK